MVFYDVNVRSDFTMGQQNYIKMIKRVNKIDIFITNLSSKYETVTQ